MNEKQKVSAMMINVAGDLLKTPESQLEMQTHLDLVKTAWNIAIKPEMARKREINSFIKKQEKYAPNAEALKGLEWEIRRLVKQKDKLYPAVNNKIVLAEVIETGIDDYIIRAYFAGQKDYL